MAKKKILPGSLFMGSLFDDEPPVADEIGRAAERMAREAALISMRRAAAATDASIAGDDIFEPIDARAAGGRLLFMSLGSGSSGNCYYVGTADAGVLIDAGLDLKHVESSLAGNGIAMEAVKGIMVTHDHSDHVKYVYSIVRIHRHIGVYCTPRCLSGIMRRHSVSRRLKDYHRPIYKEFAVEVAGLEITAFDVSHDGTDNVGYFVSESRSGATLCLATDLGVVTERVEHYMALADAMVIESNYDSDMLAVGPYTEYLKARIRAASGHLDNAVTGDFVARMAAGNERLHSVFLCHLSHDNNRPEVALATVRRALEAAGLGPVGDGSMSVESRDCRVQLVALPRHDATRLYRL